MPSVVLPAESDPSVARLSSRRPIALTILLSLVFHALVISILLSWYPRESAQTGDATGLHLDIVLNALAGDENAPGHAVSVRELPPEIADVADVALLAAPADNQPQTDDVADVVEPVAVEHLNASQIENIANIEFLASDVTSAWQVAVTAEEPDDKDAIDTFPEPATKTLTSSRELSADELTVLEPRINQWISQAQWVEHETKSISIEHDGRQFSIEVSLLPAGDVTAFNQMHLEISKIQDGTLFSSSVRVREKAFSHYAKLIDRWDPEVRLSDDRVDGRFHSNSPINLANRGVRPLFNGPVTLAARQSLSRSLRESIFAGGVETGVRQVHLPRSVALQLEQDMEQGGRAGHEITVRYFDEDTHIVFERSGNYIWHTGIIGNSERELIGDNPAYLIARNNARLSVEGEVRGQVLVYAPRRITISGDLVYARDPKLFPDSDDFLGLISDGSVEVAESHVTGPGDLTIQAAIFAKTRFSVRRFRDRAQGVLTIFGSVSAGSVSATEPRYSTRVEYDNRLETRRPPSFPTTGHFEMAAWDRQWYSQDSHR